MNSFKWLWILGFALVLLVGFFNQGIIALDDYSEGYARFLPAQNITFQQNLDGAGIRLPFQSVFLLSLSKTALFLGLTSPINQARFVLMILGALIFSIQTYCAIHFFEDKRKRLLALLFSAFYFILPLIYTRPLIENMSGAFVTLSAFFAFRFHQRKETRWIFASVVSLATASLFRFQTGVSALALGVLVLLSKNKRAGLVFLLSCVATFFATGLLDGFLTGGFHRSLWAYFKYNVDHSSSYGTTPFYTFLLLFIGLSLPPTFWGRYPGFHWGERYHRLLAPLLFFLVFVGAHSMVPHKEERFMIPVLPLFLVLLVPLAEYWIFEIKSWWRVAYFTLLNCSLLLLASFSVPQNNVISLVRYLDEHPEIQSFLNYCNSAILIPKAFSVRTFGMRELGCFDAFSMPTRFKEPCEERWVVSNQQDAFGFKLVASFSPGPLEALLVKLNPRQNARRGTLFLLKDPRCD